MTNLEKAQAALMQAQKEAEAQANADKAPEAKKPSFTPSLVVIKDGDDFVTFEDITMVTSRKNVRLDDQMKPVGVDLKVNGMTIKSYALTDSMTVYSIKTMLKDAADFLKGIEFRATMETSKDGTADILTIEVNGAVVRLFITTLESAVLHKDVREQYGLMVCHCAHYVGNMVDNAMLTNSFINALDWLKSFCPPTIVVDNTDNSNVPF